MDDRYIKHDDIGLFLRDVFASIKCPKDIYESVVGALIETSLRGVDSHGIRLAPHYVDAALIGRINLQPTIQIKDTSVTTALLNADHTYGITAGRIGMKRAIEKAEENGLGCVAVYNSSHFGAAAIYSLMAANSNMIGFSFTNVDALVFPYGAGKPYVGTNPICFAAPCEGEEPFCLDMATSTISWNKLRCYRKDGRSLERGLAGDKSGNECDDPSKASGLFPIGKYKGYGLAVMVDILCSLLTGMPFGIDVARMFPLDDRKRCLGHFLLAVDIKRFVDINVFKARMKTMVSCLRHLPVADGIDRVRVANDPEKEAYADRITKGIPVTMEDIQEFQKTADRTNIDIRKYPKIFF